MKAQYYKKEMENTIQCELCPHRCRIKPGKSGICGVRENEEGEMVLPYYGRLSSVAVDPIEKKPLYHFHPGKEILSVGFWGCNLQCPFCQNYRISQNLSPHSEYVSPEKLIDLALKQESFAIAYTYSEPLIHFEYVLESARLAREKGLKNVLVSNGQLLPEPAEKLLPLLDAANIDLKSFNADFYKKELKGSLEAVKTFLTQAAGQLSLEVTTLIIPGKNDSEKEVRSIASFVASLDKNIPLHLSCYYPTYKYNIPATSPNEIFQLAEIARQELNYVYPGNVGFSEVKTSCPSCGALLISRKGYNTRILGLSGGKCKSCGQDVPIEI